MASLLDLDIEATCSLTNMLSIDNFETPTARASDIDKTYNAMSFQVSQDLNQRKTDSLTNPGSCPDNGNSIGLLHSGYKPTVSWNQTSPPPFVIPRTTARSSYAPGNGISLPALNGPPHSIEHGMSYPSFGGVSITSNASRLPSRAGASTAAVSISQDELNSCYAYAIDRGNGQITRLIPADCLPPLKGLAQTQGPEGLIILPNPRGPFPLSYPSLALNTYYSSIPSVIGDGRPVPASSDPVQKTIDKIVAALPEGELPLPPKKAKVYCDKWLHDGTCAFTQQGCRYKHEMPMDRATQVEVGLFNGLPAWYRRLHAVELKSKSPIKSSAQASSHRGGFRGQVHEGLWRRHGSSSTPCWRSTSGVSVNGPSRHFSKNIYDILYEGEVEKVGNTEN